MASHPTPPKLTRIVLAHRDRQALVLQSHVSQRLPLQAPVPKALPVVPVQGAVAEARARRQHQLELGLVAAHDVRLALARIQRHTAIAARVKGALVQHLKVRLKRVYEIDTQKNGICTQTLYISLRQ